MHLTKKRKFSAILSLVLVFTMLFGGGSVFAEGSSDGTYTTLNELQESLVQKYSSEYERNIINEKIEKFRSDKMFWNHCEYNVNDAIENVRMVIENEINSAITPRWYEGGVYGTNVPLIQQKTNYYCGPASALQVISSLGYAGNVSGSTNFQKQDTLAREMGTNTGGTDVGPLCSFINNYSGYHVYEKASGIRKDTLELRIIQSLRVDEPVIILCNTSSLSYYNGYQTGHYIVIKAYNPSNGKVILSDCNNNNRYFGEHVVTIDEVYNSLQAINPNKPRYIFYGV